MNLRIVDDGSAPDRILCQTERGSCASCCGTWNFRDRSPSAMHARFARRTERVRAAFPDVEALARARDALLGEERGELLSDAIPVCPFAGYIDVHDDGAPRVGCMIHPSRHPAGDDLRDLAVYPRAVCAGHFCAPHDWLSTREKDVARFARGHFYSRVVTDAGLVKALVRLVEDALCRRLTDDDLRTREDEFAALFRMLERWPFADPDPARFGGFVVDAGGVERTIANPALDAVAPRGPARTVLDALGTRALTADEATRALTLLDEAVRAVASP